MAYDLIFTVLLSLLMLGRESLYQMRANLYLPVILSIVSIVFAEHFDTTREDNQVHMQVDSKGIDSFSGKERYMYAMSRFAFCFVNVAAKLFLFKGAAFQKAWSRLSERHNEEKFDEVME